MTKIHHRCPECGSRDDLLGRADAKWSFDQQQWIIGDMEDQIDCNECDWSGQLEDTVYQDEPIEAPHLTVAQIVQDVIGRGKGGNDVEQYTIECARDKMTELIAAGLAETADLFATAMEPIIGEKPEPWPS